MQSKAVRIRSALERSGIHWPAAPNAAASRLLALLCQFQLSEFWSADALLDAQRAQAGALLSHARARVPFYAPRFRGELPIPATSRWLELPLLTREDLLLHRRALCASQVSKLHGRRFVNRTSGSTGQPVEVVRTEWLQQLWEVQALREHVWHQRDVSASLAVIRANVPNTAGPQGRHEPSWGSPFSKIWETGPAHILSLATDVVEQARWLQTVQPAYLLTYPTNLAALLDVSAQVPLPPLRGITCVGETVPEQLRIRCTDTLHAPIVANYSSQELGYLALQCPDCSQYHVQSESIFMEILDDEGRPCVEGESGRVVVTDLHNFAMPLIRYETGDHARVGKPCSAGRGLPSLSQVLGRSRNMVIYPDGRRHWPLTGFGRFNQIAHIRQYQFVQHTREEIEVRLVVGGPLSEGQIAALRQLICEALGYSFKLRFSQSNHLLPQSRGGKFEEFICQAH